MRGDRDDVVGDALRALDVPEHGPDFRARLMSRLEQDAATRAAPLHRARRASPYLFTAAAAIIAVAVLTTSLRTSDHIRPRIEPKLITASAVRARVAGALASLKSLGKSPSTARYPRGFAPRP